MVERLTHRTWRQWLSLGLLVLCVLAAALVGFLVACDPRVFVPPAPITRAPSLTPTATHTATPTLTFTRVFSPTHTATFSPTATVTPSPSFTPTAEPTRTATPTLGLITKPGRDNLPTTGAPASSFTHAWLVIFGVVLFALGAWVFDASVARETK